jgi:hypothetical protein
VQDPKKEFVKIFRRIAPNHDRYEVWRDFLEMAYCAIKKQTLPPGAGADALEARYMIVVGRHDKEDIRKMPELLGITQIALSTAGTGDFIGELYGELELRNRDRGQFFTPYHLSRMMVEMTLDTVDEIIVERGYVTIQEPASGAGGMILAAAEVFQRKGFDVGRQMYVEAIDISDLCYKMSYLQASLRGVPATIRHGDTLRGKIFESANTPIFYPFYLTHKVRFDEWIKAEDISAVGAEGVPKDFDAEISQADPEVQIGLPASPARPIAPPKRGRVKPRQLSLF